MASLVTVSGATRVQQTALRVIGVGASVAGLTAVLAAPVHADMLGSAFLRALTNAGVPVSEPDGTMALGQSVCPMLVQPGGSFDSVLSTMAAGTGMSPDAAGVFTIVAIATYCPAVLAPLLSSRVPA